MVKNPGRCGKYGGKESNLFSTVQHCYTRFRLNNVVQTILLTTVNNVGTTIVFNIAIQKAQNF